MCACGGGCTAEFLSYLISAERMRGFISLHLVLSRGGRPLSRYSHGLALPIDLSVCRETLQNSLRSDGVG